METIIKPFQLGISAGLIDNYTGNMPFSNYFAEQCKLHRNWGSRDRKIYKQACYAYLRLGFAVKEGSTESNIRFALQPVEELLTQIDLKAIFPHAEFISPLIRFDEWSAGLLFQKPVYLAIVNGCETLVKLFLKDNQPEHQEINSHAIRVNANSNCNAIVENGWAWIMDISSQGVADAIKINENEKVWDCCCGAGGKAMFLTNAFSHKFRLTCSDARFSILENLKERFKLSHLPMPSIELCDLNSAFHLKERYDVIVADVPCTGSGTWGRTPENITRTDIAKIEFYAKLQRTIIDNARKNLKSGGRIYYITCSVFSKENELNVQYFEEKSGLKMISQKYYNVAGRHSDWLYCVEMEKI